MNTRNLSNDFSSPETTVEVQSLNTIKVLTDEKVANFSVSRRSSSFIPKKIMPTHSMLGMKSFKPKKLSQE